MNGKRQQLPPRPQPQQQEAPMAAMLEIHFTNGEVEQHHHVRHQVQVMANGAVHLMIAEQSGERRTLVYPGVDRIHRIAITPSKVEA